MRQCSSCFESIIDWGGRWEQRQRNNITQQPQQWRHFSFFAFTVIVIVNLSIAVAIVVALLSM